MKKILWLSAILWGGVILMLSSLSCESLSNGETEQETASAFVIWEPIENATNYYIGVQNSSGKVSKYVSTNSSENYYEWQNLEDSKEYTFNVWAEFANKTNTRTSPKEITVCAAKGGKCLRVMGYFLDTNQTVDEQNLHLAITTDGLHWQSLNSNKSVFQISKIGGNRLRDPYIVKKADGTYLMIATDWTTYQVDTSGLKNHRLYDGTTSEITNWNYTTSSYWDVNTSCLIFADSADLITWTNERQIQMVSDSDKQAFYAKNSNYQFCWAPEIIHDNGNIIFTDPETNESYKYGVIWSGQGETNGETSKSYSAKTNSYQTTSGHSTSYRRTFVNYTNDFETFSVPQVYFDPKNSNIDASVCTDGKGKFYLFYKDEKSGYYGMAENYSTSLLPNSFNSNYIYSRAFNGKQVQEAAGGTYNQGEGMFCFKPNAGVDKWLCVLDAHDAHQSKVFATFETKDFVIWKENDNTSWPSGDIRHGCSVEITLGEMQNLINAFGF